MRLAIPVAASALWMAILAAQSATAPSVEINYPGSSANRYINLSLNGFLQHGLGVNDRGAPGEMAGILLASFLETAGWGKCRRTKYRTMVRLRMAV